MIGYQKLAAINGGHLLQTAHGLALTAPGSDTRKAQEDYVKLAALEYACAYLLHTTRHLLDGGEFHHTLADHVRDVLAVAKQRPEVLP